MIEALLRQLLRLPMAGKVVVAGFVIVVISGSAIAMNAAVPHRSTASFCKVYRDEKARYLAKTGKDVNSAGDVVEGFSAVLSIPEMFDHLDRVAPDDIEPDVARIRDAFKAARESAVEHGGDPATAIGGSMVAGLMAGDSFERVSTYVDANCTTPEERARRERQANLSTVQNADQALSNALGELDSAIKEAEDRLSGGDPLAREDIGTPSLYNTWAELQSTFTQAKADAAAHPHPESEPGLCLVSDVKSMGSVQGAYDVLQTARAWAPGGSANDTPDTGLLQQAIDPAQKARDAFAAANTKVPDVKTTNTTDEADAKLAKARDLVSTIESEFAKINAKADEIEGQADTLLAKAKQAHLLPDHC